MNPKIRALLWEQFRTAGTLTLWTLALTILVIASTIISTWMLSAEDFITVSIFCITGIPLLLLFRQNVAGQVDIQYEPRMSRLPVDTMTLALIPLVVRLLCITFYFAGLNLLNWVVFGGELPLYILVNTCALYAILQALVWSRTYLIVALLPIAALGYGIWRVIERISTSDFTEATKEFLYDRLIVEYIRLLSRVFRDTVKGLEYNDFTEIFLVLLPLALLLACQGVRWERRNEQRRFLNLSGVAKLAEKLRSPLSHGFSCVSEARVWFERSENGIVVGIIFAISMLLFPLMADVNPFGMDVYVIGKSPYLGLACAAILLGVIRDFSRHLWPLSMTEFTRTKPISNAWLAWFHIIVMTRYAFIALVVFFVLSNVVYALTIPEFSILVTMMREGVFGLDPLYVIVEPLFWGCLFVWIGLWCAEPIVLGLMVLLAIDLPNQFTIQYSPIISGDAQNLFLYGFCLYLLIRSVRLLHYAWKNEIFTIRQWSIYAAAHLLLPLLIWWPCPSEVPAALESFYLTLAFTSLVLSPIIALPRQVARKRALA